MLSELVKWYKLLLDEAKRLEREFVIKKGRVWERREMVGWKLDQMLAEIEARLSVDVVFGWAELAG